MEEEDNMECPYYDKCKVCESDCDEEYFIKSRHHCFVPLNVYDLLKRD
jgi:hypothetical protein